MGGGLCLGYGTSSRLSHVVPEAAVRGGDTLSALAEANPNTPVFTTQILCCVPNRLLCYLGKDLLTPAPLTCSYLKMRNDFIQ